MCLFDITPGGIFVLMLHIFSTHHFCLSNDFLSLSSERKEEKDRSKTQGKEKQGTDMNECIKKCK